MLTFFLLSCGIFFVFITYDCTTTILLYTHCKFCFSSIQAPGGYGGGPPPPQPGYGGQPAGYPPQPAGYPPQQPGYGGYPGIDPQVMAWFQAVDADRSGHISAAELRQALTNSNYSHFNEEACRLMIGLFIDYLSGFYFDCSFTFEFVTTQLSS